MIAAVVHVQAFMLSIGMSRYLGAKSANCVTVKVSVHVYRKPSPPHIAHSFAHSSGEDTANIIF